MRRFIISILLFLPIVACAQRFAVVDRQAVLESLDEYLTAERTLFDLSQKYHAEYDRMSADIDKKFEDYQSLNTTTNPPQTIRERRVQEIQEMQKRAQQFLISAEDDLKTRREDMLRPINEKVDAAIKDAGIEGGFSFIFPLGTPLFFGIDVEDITESIKEKLTL
ncbi:MAG: OmpH family outer membrane protein [Bacteroides sp.]|nr:OmpH family outer membrane protein [Bacteroidales bacterium]MBD5378791.1 OmpH family outer membrane protein [Bacteroides sp.]MDE5808848.1 OmpH family outer membrane protein [Muribaculaceae bacterium]